MCRGEPMRRRLVMMVLAGAAAVWCTAPLPVTAEPAARAVAWAGTWGTAIEVPGLASLNQGGQAEVRSVSCGAAGNCAAAGGYLDGSFRYQVFVVSETNGTFPQGDRGPRLGHPERRSVWQRHHGVVRHGRQLRRRPDLHGRHRATAGVRGQSDE